MTDIKNTKENSIPSGWLSVDLEYVIASANTGLDAIKRAPIVKENTGVKCFRIQDASQKKDFEDWGNTKVEDRNYKKFKLLKGDILIARTGNSIGVNYLVKNDMISVFNNGLIRLRVNKKIDFTFLYKLIESKNFDKYIQSIAYGTSTQPNMKISALLTYPLLLPPIIEQRAIADVLLSFDKKIELLQNQNKTLEEIGKNFFKEMSSKYISDDQNIKAQDVLEFQKGIEVGSKKYFQKINELENPVMFYRVGDISSNGNVSSIYCEKDLLKNRTFENNDILVSFDGTVGRVYVGGNGGYSSGMRKVFSKDESIKNSFIYFWAQSKKVQETIKLFSEGTTIQHAGKSIAYLNMFSDNKEIEKITELLEPVFRKILENLKQIHVLRMSIDTLSPKLMKGEIRVNLN